MQSKRHILVSLVATVSLLVLVGAGIVLAQGPDTNEPASTQAALGTGFTYQGRLTNGGSPVNATCNFRFSLWDAGGTSGNQIGNDHTVSNVQVADGRFTAQVNTGSEFGANAFTGDARWLEVEVNCPSDSGFQVLGRQQLQPTPFAHFANDGPFWKLTGNAGTNANTDFLGTTDATTLTLAVSDTTALRIAPASGYSGFSPNIVGGHSSNSVGSAFGATVSGGGDKGSPNKATAPFATVGGGQGNTAGVNGATVGGGTSNTASGNAATIGGGFDNAAGGINATVGGGTNNRANYRASTVGGGTFNRTAAMTTTIGGGGRNSVDGAASTVGGGVLNSAQGDYATIAGGGPADPNNATSSNNRVFDDYGTVGGGGDNQAGTDDGTANSPFATVGGGRGNSARGSGATVGGGRFNLTDGAGATVAGGAGNLATGPSTFIGGGDGNKAGVSYGNIGGGLANVISGTTEFATIGGGRANVISDTGTYATIPGGRANRASGAYSFAAGRQANAVHEGSFVWADARGFNFQSYGANSFAVRATGGITMVTGINFLTGLPTSGVQVPPNGTSWTSYSDRRLKKDFRAVDSKAIAAKVAGLPITTWRYEWEDGDIRHMGPMAQDFNAAFDIGRHDMQLSTQELDGIALASIQGVYELMQEKDARIATLEDENATLRTRVDDLESRVDSLERLVAEDVTHERGARSGFPLPAPGWLVAGLLLGYVLWRRER